MEADSCRRVPAGRTRCRADGVAPVGSRALTVGSAGRGWRAALDRRSPESQPACRPPLTAGTAPTETSTDQRVHSPRPARNNGSADSASRVPPRACKCHPALISAIRPLRSLSMECRPCGGRGAPIVSRAAPPLSHARPAAVDVTRVSRQHCAMAAGRPASPRRRRLMFYSSLAGRPDPVLVAALFGTRRLSTWPHS